MGFGEIRDTLSVRAVWDGYGIWDRRECGGVMEFGDLAWQGVTRLEGSEGFEGSRMGMGSAPFPPLRFSGQLGAAALEAPLVCTGGSLPLLLPG